MIQRLGEKQMQALVRTMRPMAAGCRPSSAPTWFHEHFGGNNEIH
jgi:hypothetical protein